jgi:hypothetical protein
MGGTVDEAARICARLLRQGAVARVELHELDHSEIRSEVEERLERVGLVLATSAYADHVGLRLSPSVTADSAFDAASNLGLRADHCALLTILWARLVLQKRTAVDTEDSPGPRPLLPADRADQARRFAPNVRMETLVREFGKVLGSRTHIKSLVSRLRALGFLAGHGETIEPGPLLELGIDGERMIGFIRRGVLADIVAQKDVPAQIEDGAEAKVLRVLDELGGEAVMADLERATGQPRNRLRRILQDLIAAGSVHRSGERADTRYVKVQL